MKAKPLIYLDANASEPLRPEARAAMLAALEVTGNPSSIHAAGRAARRLLEEAREQIAARFGAHPARLIFTSGATEADALALLGLGRGRPLLVSAIEHEAVRRNAPDAILLPVDRYGRLELDALAEALARHSGALVALMSANNETGVLQPIAEAAALCRAHGALLHVDAAQSAGRVPLDFSGLGAASLALSSHKLGGPAGAGALLLDEAAFALLQPLWGGGGQERGLRAGTPALPNICGFAAAAAAAAPRPDWPALRARLEAAAKDAGARVIGEEVPRLPNTSALALPGVPAQTQVITLDLAGIAVSAGSACSSGRLQQSHVLTAMGLGRLAEETIRVSLPWSVTPDDITAFIDAYTEMARRLSPAHAPAPCTPGGDGLPPRQHLASIPGG